MFDDDDMLMQKGWDCLLSDKVSSDNWKDLDNNKIIIHASKAKEEMLDQFDKEARTVKLMMEESLGFHNSVALEEVSALFFERSRVV